MNDVIINVARKGEGKTIWLLSVAHHYSTKNIPVYLLVETEKEFNRFCDKYSALYGKICKVKKMDSIEDGTNSIVLIDDLFERELDMSYIRQLKSICNKMFIAIEGSTEDNEESTEVENDYEQLTLF